MEEEIKRIKDLAKKALREAKKNKPDPDKICEILRSIID